MSIKMHVWAPGFADFGGGIGAFSNELVQAINRLDGVNARLFGKVDRSCAWKGMKLSGGGAFPACLQTIGFAATGGLAALVDKPKLIISSHLNFGPALHQIKRLTGTPFILVAHGIDVDPEMSLSRLSSLRAADQVVVVSHWTRERVLALGGIEEEKVVVLPNTYDDQRFNTGEDPLYLRERYAIQPDEKVILTVARLDANEGYKGYDRILASLPQIKKSCHKIRFIIAGKGDDQPRLEALACELGVDQLVSFAGFVPDEELADHYRLADLFAMPSTGEGFGIVFLEAMACGTPVLGGNQDGSVDALAGGQLGKLVDPSSEVEIACGLIEILQGQGPSDWFDRSALSQRVLETYGRDCFYKRVAQLWGS